MSETPIVAEQATEKLSTLDRIQVLANLANAVQDESVKGTLLALKDGDRLYQIFANAVSREIETMMNPVAAVAKDMVDAQEVAQRLREQMIHMYNAMNELNNTRLMGVLTMLNTSLGGNPVNRPPASEPIRPAAKAPAPVIAPQAPRQEPNEPQVGSGLGRSNNTGMSW